MKAPWIIALFLGISLFCRTFELGIFVGVIRSLLLATPATATKAIGKMKKSMNIAITVLLVILASCRSAKEETTVAKTGKQKIEMNLQPGGGRILSGGTPFSTSPVVYIYKTKADYSHQVPVLMDESRTRILSYPAPSDLKLGDALRLPTPLNGGYLLDNKGIGPNVAFLTYTYEAYSQLAEAPSMDELLANIAEKYPLLEIRACGRRADYQDIVSELNEKISNGFLEK